MQSYLGNPGSVSCQYALFGLSGQPVSHRLLPETLFEALTLFALRVLL